MKNEILSLAQAAERIAQGAVMSIAGPSHLLARLPKGNWIGGSTVYFMAEEGGIVEHDRLFCTTVPEAASVRTVHLATEDLPGLAKGYAPGGFTLICVPAFSDAHVRFAEGAAGYDGLFDQPLIGWIAGVALDRIGTEAPQVFDGATGQAHGDGAVLLHISLPEGVAPHADIVNIFSQGADETMSFAFDEAGFSASKARVNGKVVDLAAYLIEHKVDTKLPLVANYAGALVNVSFQSVDAETGEVKFYAPVFPGVDYRLASPVTDYPAAFAAQLSGRDAGSLSCNCILNFVYGGLEGKKTPGFTGPVTFGEIAYILLNQTLVTLECKAA